MHIVVLRQQQALNKHKCKHYIDVYAYYIVYCVICFLVCI